MLFLDTHTTRKTASRTILQRLAESDTTAVQDCLTAYGDLIWTLIKTKTSSVEEAERLTRDAFQNIWHYAARFDPAKCDEATFISLIVHRQLNLH